MGTNNPYLPDNVRCDEEAIQYLAMMVAAMKGQTYTAKTGAGPIALTATEMVGGVVEHSGQTGAVSFTTATAAAIIARMQALDANAGVGSTALFVIVNDNTSSGAITLSSGDGGNVTIVGSAVTAIATVRKYQIKILTATTVSLTNVG
jgi:hypothetical protein